MRYIGTLSHVSLPRKEAEKCHLSRIAAQYNGVVLKPMLYKICANFSNSWKFF